MEFPRENVRALIPMQPILQSGCLKEPVSGVIYYRSEVFPVIGPIDLSESSDSWLLLANDHARMIYGYPVFPEDSQDLSLVQETEDPIDESIEIEIAKELEELQKIA